MQTNTLFMGWNAPKTGREQQAGELFEAVTSYWTGVKNDGLIDGFDPVILSSHGGNLNGFFLIRGLKNYDKIRNSDEFIKLVMQCNYVLDGFGTVVGYHGKEVSNLMGKWRKMVGSN